MTLVTYETIVAELERIAKSEDDTERLGTDMARALAGAVRRLGQERDQAMRRLQAITEAHNEVYWNQDDRYAAMDYAVNGGERQ